MELRASLRELIVMNLTVAVFAAPFQWIFRAWVPRSKKATPGPLFDLQAELTSAKKWRQRGHDGILRSCP
jgi:hypothetical protein